MRKEDEIRNEFLRLGISVSDWARSYGYSVPLVYQVLSGSRKGIRGQSHEIAVRLGLKAGAIGEIRDLRLGMPTDHRATNQLQLDLAEDFNH